MKKISTVQVIAHISHSDDNINKYQGAVNPECDKERAIDLFRINVAKNEQDVINYKDHLNLCHQVSNFLLRSLTLNIHIQKGMIIKIHSRRFEVKEVELDFSFVKNIIYKIYLIRRDHD